MILSTTIAQSLITLLSISSVVYAASPTLDINNAQQLTAAATSALANLQNYYHPNSLGVFDQVETPWFESGVIWGMYFDHLKWTGDGKFINTVGNALANASFNSEQDFLNGNQASLEETLNGKWNDDILWPAQAIIAGAEVFGFESIQPGTNGGKWFKTAQVTFDQAYEQWDEKCGGGIYWSRDRNSLSAKYKSVITNLEFIAQGARIFIQSKNQTVLNLAQDTLDWVIASGLANPSNGMIYDGFNVDACLTYTGSQWTYNYGAMIGAMSWMHAATGNETFLTIATPFLNNAITTFTSTTNGVITEQCELSVTCRRDQQGFKAILARNLAYLYRETSDPSIKTSIQNVVDSSVRAMVKNSCDTDWNCGGNWTTDNGPSKNPRSQHVSSALLVAAVGIHTSATGAGLLTNINTATLVTTASGTGANNYDPEAVQPGMVESRPLNEVGRSMKIDRFVVGLGVISCAVGIVIW